MLTAKNSRKRIEACSPVVAASVGRAAEVIGTSWFTDTVRCNGFGNRGSALASPFRSQNPRRRLCRGCRCPRHGVRSTHRRLRARLAAYHAAEITFAELDTSIQGWIAHVGHADR